MVKQKLPRSVSHEGEGASKGYKKGGFALFTIIEMEN